MLRSSVELLAEQAVASCSSFTSRYVHTAIRNTSLPKAAPLSRKVKQEKIKKVKEKHEFALRVQELNKPDPYLGHQDNEEGDKFWKSSELFKVILSKDAVWGVREDRRGNLVKIDTSISSEPPIDKQESEEAAWNLPERLNFGFDNLQDKQMLFSDLPNILQKDVMKFHIDPSSTDQKLIDEIEDMQWKGQKGVDILSRVLDLKNASGKGIIVENTRRIIDHFGAREAGDEKGPDTGSVEVQVAVLTYRIRNMHEHLEDGNRNDKSNRRSMNQLVQQRATLLKYLKRKSLSRYQSLLSRIGVVPKAVEGEVMVMGKPRMKIVN